MNRRRSQLADRIKKLRGELSQDEFAAAVGVPRSRVSESETGKTPTAEMKLLLGIFAAKQRKYDDAIYFWDEAGLAKQYVKSVAAGLRTAKSVKAKSGDLIRIPLSEKVAGEKEQKGSPRELQFPASMVSGSVEPTFVRIGYDFQQYRRGDLLLIDESETDLVKLEGSRLAYARLDAFLDRDLDQRWQEKLAEASKEEREEILERAQMPFEHFGVFAGWLRRESNIFFVDAPSRLLRSVISRMIGAVTQAGQVNVNADLTVLGRVIGCISAEALSSLPREGEKK